MAVGILGTDVGIYILLDVEVKRQGGKWDLLTLVSGICFMYIYTVYFCLVLL